MPVPAPVTSATLPVQSCHGRLLVELGSVIRPYSRSRLARIRWSSDPRRDPRSTSSRERFGRVAPAAAAGHLDRQPVAGLEHDLALRERRLAVLEHLARAGRPCRRRRRSRDASRARWRDRCSSALDEVAQHDALAEAAAVLAGAAESGISSLHSVSTGTAISNISIGVTLQFDGKLSVSRPSSSSNAPPCPPWKFCAAPYCVPSSRWPWQLTPQIGAPPLSPMTLSGTTPFSALKIRLGNDVADQVARIAGRHVVRIEDRALRRLVGDRRHAAFVVRRVRIEQALQRIDRVGVAVVASAR